MKFNRQGREVSDSMRLKYFSDWAKSQPKPPSYHSEEYRGFIIHGRTGAYTITSDGKIWPIGFTSIKRARKAIDKCLAIREELRET